MSQQDGKAWADLRAREKLSREKFATRVGLTPGAIWRIEAKSNFKPGELEKLLTAYPNGPGEAPQTPPPTLDPPPPVVLDGPHVSAVQDELVDDDDVLLGVTSPPPTVTDVTGSSVLIGGHTGSYALGDVLPDISISKGGITWPVVVEAEKLAYPLEPEVPGVTELSPYQRFLQDGIRRYSNSEIQTFKRCRRKWYLAYYRQLTPKHQSPVGARAIGDRTHRALRWHYHPDPKLRVDVLTALEAIIVSDYQTLRKHYAPDPIPLSLDTDFKKDADLERVMLGGYVEWLAATGADSEYEFLSTEEYVEVDVSLPTGGTVRLIARLDARMRRLIDNALLFLDHKTVGGFDGPTRVLHLNEQMLFYLVIENLRNPDHFVDGAIFNMLRRSKRTATAKPPFYQRVEVRHNPTTLQNFINRTIGTITEIERVRQALDEGADHRFIAFPTPSQDCTWSCDFLALDGLMDDGSNWEGMAGAFFNVGDPTGYYVKDNILTAS